MLNRNQFFIIFILIVIFLLQACKNDDQTHIQTSWSANDPIAIPINNRMHEKNLGNLVPNSSFEAGKVYYEKSNIKSFDITGWKKIGEHVQWINSNEKEYDNSDVYEGNHSIKIVRNIADETEITGEGIISDYIKVIPGNYSLKLFLKFQDIYPNQTRIGAKMLDAINIRLIYFDKNKIEIDVAEMDAFKNIKIDNSFKSYSLSNFWSISELAWSEINGKTAGFPFFDGDIPDATRYVKILIGLKGTGEMWIDQVDLRYTDQNFTLLERVKPYFDSSLTVYELIYPKPKLLQQNGIIEFIKNDTLILPIILIPVNANEKIVQLAEDIKSLIGNAIKLKKSNFDLNQIKIVNSLAQDLPENQTQIFSIGETYLYTENIHALPDSIIKDKDQSYFLYQIENQKNTIFIQGNANRGLDYAMFTFKQLFNSQKVVFYSANIIDYPDFLKRGYLLQSFPYSFGALTSHLVQFDQVKLNDLYFLDYFRENLTHYPFASFTEFQNKSGKSDFSVAINLLDKKNEEINEQLKQFELLTLKSILLLEGNNIDISYSEKLDLTDLKSENKNQNDQIEWIKQIKQELILSEKETALEFLPLWSNLGLIDQSRLKAEFYYRDFSKKSTESISLYWTGTDFCINKMDFAEVQRIKSIIGYVPSFFDNSLLKTKIRFESESVQSFYAGKLRMLSLFEPYKLDVFADFYKQNTEQKVVLNLDGFSELNSIQLLTAANYFWNCSDYNPDKSLWIVLNNLYGRDNAINLLYFNDAYYGLFEICKKIEISGAQHKNVRIARNFENELVKYFGLLKSNISNETLLLELEQLKTNLLTKYNRLLETGN